jgi:hypothetical protein
MFLNPEEIVPFSLITKAHITQNNKPSPSSFIMYEISCSRLNLIHTDTHRIETPWSVTTKIFLFTFSMGTGGFFPEGKAAEQ